MPGVLLALDYGTKRIGIAVSTPLGTVHPRPRLRRTTLEKDLDALNALVEENEAEAVVMGLPHNMDGSESEMEREVRAFAKELARRCPIPIYGTDERLTSEAAAACSHWRSSACSALWRTCPGSTLACCTVLGFTSAD